MPETGSHCGGLQCDVVFVRIRDVTDIGARGSRVPREPLRVPDHRCHLTLRTVREDSRPDEFDVPFFVLACADERPAAGLVAHGTAHDRRIVPPQGRTDCDHVPEHVRPIQPRPAGEQTRQRPSADRDITGVEAPVFEMTEHFGKNLTGDEVGELRSLPRTHRDHRVIVGKRSVKFPSLRSEVAEPARGVAPLVRLVSHDSDDRKGRQVPHGHAPNGARELRRGLEHGVAIQEHKEINWTVDLVDGHGQGHPHAGAVRWVGHGPTSRVRDDDRFAHAPTVQTRR